MRQRHPGSASMPLPGTGVEKGNLFVGLDEYVVDPTATFSYDQTFMKAQLARQAGHKFVFMQQPVWNNKANELAPNASTLADDMNSGKVDACLSGPLPSFSCSWLALGFVVFCYDPLVHARQMAALRRVNRYVVEDSARTAFAAVVSLLVARSLHMPEAYWATISTIIVTQSTLGATVSVSWQRFAGTVVGAGSGALLGTYFQSNLAIFGAGLFGLGLVSAVLRLGAAYRFAGITLAIIMLIPRDRPVWVVAEHRCIEVSVGIAVALVVIALWPARAQPA